MGYSCHGDDVSRAKIWACGALFTGIALGTKSRIGSYLLNRLRNISKFYWIIRFSHVQNFYHIIHYFQANGS